VRLLHAVVYDRKIAVELSTTLFESIQP
jgi:hypothetical protein